MNFNCLSARGIFAASVLISLCVPATTMGAPVILWASGHSSMDKVVIQFNEAVTPATATNPSNYQVFQNQIALGVTAASLSHDQTRVTLTTPAQNEASNCEVVINGVANSVGQTIAPNSRMSFRAFVFTPGLVKLESYDLSAHNILDLSLTPLLISSNFPDHPMDTVYIRSMTTTNAYFDRLHDNYGSRMTAVFVPPVTGNYIFYLRSDDASQLWLNPNGISDSGGIKIAEETSCCRLFGANPSTPQALIAGKRYLLQALHREGPEFDYCEVAAKLETDPSDPNFILPIPFNQLGIYADPNGTSITTEPTHDVFAVLPPGLSSPELMSEFFTAGGGGFTVSSTNPQGPWAFFQSGNVWVARGHKTCGAAESSALNSPGVQVSQSGEVFLVLTHRYNFEYDGQAKDGGQLRISVNGGAYQPVPASSFLARGYTGTIVGSNALTGEHGFTGSHPEHGGGYYITSVASLGTFNAGDIVSVQFLAAWDACNSGYDPNWEIRSVTLTYNVVPIAAASSAKIGGSIHQPVAYNWQANSGSGYVDIGSIEETLWYVPRLADHGKKFRATLTIPGLIDYTAPINLKVGYRPSCAAGGPYTATCAEDRPGLKVLLDGSASSDPAGAPLGYLWSTDCPGVTFDTPLRASTMMYLGSGFTARPSCEVKLTVTSQVGISETCTVVVNTAQSLQLPTLQLNLGDMEFSCQGSGENLYVEHGATAKDSCGRAINVSIGGNTPDSRKDGTYFVNYDAVDVFGNHARGQRTVVVLEPPAVLTDMPDDLVIECGRNGGIASTAPEIAVFLNQPKAYDGCDADEVVLNDAQPLLPIGTTPVTWSIWKGFAPTGVTDTRMVTVRDTAEPIIQNCATLKLKTNGGCSAKLPDLRGHIAASDVCSSQLSYVQAPPRRVPICR